MNKSAIPFGPADSVVTDMIRESLPHPAERPAPAPFRPPTSYELAILRGLQRQAHIYAGTVPAGVIRERRVKAKAARRARRVNRIAGQR